VSDIFVLKRLDNGLYQQTGYSKGTADINAAVLYSRKGRYGWMLDADEETLSTLWGIGVQVIPVNIVPASSV
jgi:hypothetical protein